MAVLTADPPPAPVSWTEGAWILSDSFAQGYGRAVQGLIDMADMAGRFIGTATAPWTWPAEYQRMMVWLQGYTREVYTGLTPEEQEAWRNDTVEALSTFRRISTAEAHALFDRAIQESFQGLTTSWYTNDTRGLLAWVGGFAGENVDALADIASSGVALCKLLRRGGVALRVAARQAEKQAATLPARIEAAGRRGLQPGDLLDFAKATRLWAIDAAMDAKLRAYAAKKGLIIAMRDRGAGIDPAPGRGLPAEDPGGQGQERQQARHRLARLRGLAPRRGDGQEDAERAGDQRPAERAGGERRAADEGARALEAAQGRVGRLHPQRTGGVRRAGEDLGPVEGVRPQPARERDPRREPGRGLRLPRLPPLQGGRERLRRDDRRAGGVHPGDERARQVPRLHRRHGPDRHPRPEPARPGPRGAQADLPRVGRDGVPAPGVADVGRRGRPAEVPVRLRRVEPRRRGPAGLHAGRKPAGREVRHEQELVGDRRFAARSS